MKCDIRNHSSMSGIEKVAESLYKYAQKQLGFEQPARVVFESHGDRAVDLFSPTANYNPQTRTIKIFVDHRHPKDILRSMAHELVHHSQCCQGAFDGQVDTSPGYAQNDEHMRNLEKDAYFWGNGILFRDWEDNHKSKRSWDLMNENKKMSLNELKLRQKVRRMIKGMLQEQPVSPVTATTVSPVTATTKPIPTPKTTPPPTTAKMPTQPPTGTTTPIEEGDYNYNRDDDEGEDKLEEDSWTDTAAAEEKQWIADYQGKKVTAPATAEASADWRAELEEGKPFEEGVSFEKDPDSGERITNIRSPGGRSKIPDTTPEGEESPDYLRGVSKSRMQRRQRQEDELEEQEQPLKEWYNDTLHEALLKKFKIKK